MSDWQQITEISTPARVNIASTVTPSTGETSNIDRNYYSHLQDFESNTDLDRNESDPDSVATFLDQDFWAEKEIFWEEVRQEQVQDPLDAEDQIEFSYPSVTTTEDSDTDSASDAEEDLIMTDYKSVANFMEIKQPGVTTPITEPTTVQLLNFKKVLISALRQCPLNASNKGHTYIIETIDEHRARNNSWSRLSSGLLSLLRRPLLAYC